MEMIKKLTELIEEHPDYPVVPITSSKFVDRIRRAYGYPPIGDQVCVITDVFDGLYAENEEHRFTCKKEKVTKEKMAEVIAKELADEELMKGGSEDYAKLVEKLKPIAMDMIQDAIIISLDPKPWAFEKKEEA